MSDYFVPSEFVEVLRNGVEVDDLQDLHDFDDDDVNTGLSNDQILDFPDESTDIGNITSSEQLTVDSQPQETFSNIGVQPAADEDNFAADPGPLPSAQDAVAADKTLSDGQSQADLPEVVHQPQDVPGESAGDGDQVSRLPEATPANSLFNGDPREHQPHEEYQTQYDSNGSIDDQAEASRLQDFALANDADDYGQHQHFLPSGFRSDQFEPNDFVQGHEESAFLQNMDSRSPLSNIGQPHVGLVSGHSQPQFDPNELSTHDSSSIDQPTHDLTSGDQSPQYQFDIFDSDEWKAFQERAAKILGTGVQQEQWTFDHGQDIYTGHQDGGVLIDTPALSSGQGTAGISGDPTDDLQPPTPIHSSTAVEHSSPDDSQSPSAALEPAASSPLDEELAAIDDAKSDNSDEEYDEANGPNQATFETYEAQDPLIQVDEEAPKRGRGRTGKRNGEEVWFNPKTSKWQPSASHHSVRAILIARAQAEYPNDRYRFPDATDGLPHGETAFFKPHQNRGPDRDQCADELFVWREYIPKKDEHGKLKKRAKPIYTMRNHPGYMYEGDKILLDPHDNPVVNHDFIPLTLSIYTDAAKLQEMALRPGCRQVDLWARMPRYEKRTNKNGQSEIVSLRDKNTRINMPMARFRERKGTIAGGDREGTDVIMAGLLNFYHSNGFDPIASGNSVKSFPRDLHNWEVKEVKLGNTARFTKRAGNRALDDEKRGGNYQKTLKSIENGKKRQAAKISGDTGNSSREDEPAGSSSGPQKRRRGGQEVDAGFATWDERFADQQRGPSSNHSPHGYNPQVHLHGQQNGFIPASLPPQTLSNAYGAPGGLSQNPYSQYQSYGNTQAPLPLTNSLTNNNIYNSGGHYQTDQSPYSQPRSYGNTQAQSSLTNSIINNDIYNSGGQYQTVDTGFERGSTLGPGRPQQTRNTGNYYQPAHIHRQNMVQDRPISYINPEYHFPGHERQAQYGAPIQRQQPSQGTSVDPRSRGNTLGPGGRAAHQVPMPKQVLGKRRQQAAGEVEDDENQIYETQQQHASGQAAPYPGVGSPHKRQRTYENPSPEPRPRHRQDGRSSRPQYYGAGGAPESLPPPPDNFFGTVQPGSDHDWDAESRLRLPEEVFREFGHVFGGPDRAHAANQGINQGIYTPPVRYPVYHQRPLEVQVPAVDQGVSQGMTGPPLRPPVYHQRLLEAQVPAVDQGVNQAINRPPVRYPAYNQRLLEARVPQQILGRRERGEPLGQWDEDIYMPRQNPGRQGP